MRLFWKQTPSPGNFGDVLTPKLFDFFGIKYTYDKTNYNTISIGSIASKAQYGTTVLGSGIMTARDNLCSTAQWLFVRGPLTRQQVLNNGGTCPEIYGDPAMLLPLICAPMQKTTDIGIVPHYVDYDYVIQNYPDYKIINVLNEDPLSVAREISQCRIIISSSLHGIICAHAYGGPAAWMKFGNKLKGDDVKFQDHYAAMDEKLQLSTWDKLHFTSPSFNIDPIVNIFQNIALEQNNEQELDIP